MDAGDSVAAPHSSAIGTGGHGRAPTDAATDRDDDPWRATTTASRAAASRGPSRRGPDARAQVVRQMSPRRRRHGLL